MAELTTSMLIGPLVSMVKDKMSSYLLEKYKLMEGMEEQHEILERKLPAILDIIEDAEEKGAYRAGVRAWLKALKKTSYEANDIFDEFKYEALRREAKKRGHHNMLGMDIVSPLPAYNTFVFHHRMSKKLQKIVQDIEVLVAEMNAFGFSHMEQAPSSKPSRQTDPVMIDSVKDIVCRSRNEEKKKIVKMLLDHAKNVDLLILPIVGLDGLGKTTFVQLVYSDREIEKHFQFQKWCCVSEDFDVGNIARSICNSTEKDSEKLLQDLQKELSGKRYLLVLDDVWNRDVSKWGKLKTCLQHAGTGSVILTTTRDAKVAHIMSGGKVEAYNLGNLDDVFLKEILEERAFILKKPEFNKLEDIVSEIVKRCGGSPLAATAIGAMLSTKTSKDEWMAVLKKSNICNEETGILPILRLSYDNLPLHMKQCFAFCAVFPKDYEIDVEDLIQLWIANDYIPLEEGVPLETTGRRSFDELAWRSFFQDANPNWSHFRSIKKCKIHDLMHDIALSVLGEECATITDRPDQNKLLTKHSLHVFSSYPKTDTHLIDFLKKHAPTLQTLLSPCAYITTKWTPHMPKYNSLRALKLPRCLEFKIRPRHLQHLRYLDLSGNAWIKKLPEEISILYNLQTLNVSGCGKLCRLPRDMKYMASLRHLYNEECRSLKSMPPDLGELSSLQILTYFVAAASSGCSTIGELQNLDLGGNLMLGCPENVTEAQAKAATLGNKEKLRHLSLEWSSECHKEPVPDGHKKVLEALKPHDGLDMLRIVSYKSTCLPTWMKDLSSLQKHLTELHLVGFTVCEEFPQFSHLEALQILKLEELDKLQSLCSDEASLTFLKLEELHLRNLKSMERWVAAEGREGEVTFPLLENLVIRGCPKLVTLPATPNLKVVELDEDKVQLSLVIVRCRYMSLLSKLKLSLHDEAAVELDDENVESPLLELMLSGCNFFFLSSPSKPTVGIWRWFATLVSLQICDCDALVHWPEDVFKSLISLKQLEVSGCKNLVGPAQIIKGEPAPTARQFLPHLNSLYVMNCERLTEFFVLPPSITDMRIIGCKSLKFPWEEDAVSKSVYVQQVQTSSSLEYCASTSLPMKLEARTNNPLPCLEYLYINKCDSLVTLSDLPPALWSLNIISCPNLCYVSGQLDGLKHVFFCDCNKLQSLDSLGNMPSLEDVVLERCKRLTSLPGARGSYSALKILTVVYCPAIDMKSLYQHHRQRLDSLEQRDLSHAHAIDLHELLVLWSKLKDLKTWKYAIPGCRRN
ncbi:unnamed protein product [Urochloa decumbens]|uniref:Uncharacterized protein n=1 Tax=Urochloa decumbens TaxID=240449 RepID=A0ABC9BY00_9POAL